MNKRLKITLTFIALIFTLALAIILFLLRGSLATLDGQIALSGINNSIEILRDEQGIPTISGEHRNDIAFGLGFVHGQERFFQMDLLRRSSSGELSDLFGKLAKTHDQQKRLHRFRARAELAFENLTAQDKALLTAYSTGVNAGLKQLKTKPFEYYLLQKTPQPWRAEESFLAVYAMYIDLQDELGLYERSLAAMQDNLPQDWFEFLKPQAVAQSLSEESQSLTPESQHKKKLNEHSLHWEAPISGQHQNTLSLPTTPWSQVITSKQATHIAKVTQDEPLIGSNNWGVNGQISHNGNAMVAVDMHLGIRVPNTWYRASWYLPEDGRRVTGATLPGTPIMIVGSNEHISWGFTNSYGDWSDVVKLTVSSNEQQYLTPDGWQNFTIFNEQVAGEPFLVKETIWGPVIGKDHQNNLLALRWVAHDLTGANLRLRHLESANNITEALTYSSGAGMPAQNLMIGDKNGQLAWSISGAIPNRPPLNSEYLNDWSQSEGNNWNSYLPPNHYPVVFANNQQRLWTANSRVVADEHYQTIGDGGYDIGIRSGTIKNLLFAKNQFTEQDLLDIQLNTYNPLLTRWHTLLKTHLEATLHSAPDSSSTDALKKLLSQLKHWQGKAETGSISYGIVKTFRQEVQKLAISPIYQQIEANVHKNSQNKDVIRFKFSSVDNHLENPLWLLVSKRPKHLLNTEFDSWQALFNSAALSTYDALSKAQPLEQATWAKLSQVHIQHPLSRAIPALSYFLDMEQTAMSGDRKHVVRVQGPHFGASQRMVVSPGFEEQGIFHMATGQSGHPLSPFYRAGHNDWVEGKSSPFLPSESIYNLTLLPKQ